MEVFTGFLESPLNNSVDDADAVAPSEHVDEEHLICVPLFVLRELDDN